MEGLRQECAKLKACWVASSTIGRDVARPEDGTLLCLLQSSNVRPICPIIYLYKGSVLDFGIATGPGSDFARRDGMIGCSGH